MKEFLQKGWSRASYDWLVQKIDAHGTTDMHPGSGRPKSVRTTDNISIVQDLICSPDNTAHARSMSRRQLQYILFT